MAITEQLYQFAAKSPLVPADILYCGDSANSFNEVQTTVAGLIGAYPNLLAAAGDGAVTFSSVTFNSTSGIIGTGTNDSAAVGSVGELDSVVVLSGSAVNLTTATPANVMLLVLQPGDYDVWAELWTVSASSATTTSILAGLSTTTGTLPTVPALGTSLSSFYGSLGANVGYQLPISACRISVAALATATVYLVVNAAFATGTLGGYGKIMARRRR